MLEVSHEESLAADAATVWQLVSEFGKIADWHPACSSSSSEVVDGAEVRTITVGDGARLIEKLERKDDAGMVLAYSIVDGPLPVADYLSTMQVLPEGEGSKLVWSGRFNAAGAPDERAKQIIAGIYQTGLRALKTKFG